MKNISIWFGILFSLAGSFLIPFNVFAVEGQGQIAELSCGGETARIVSVCTDRLERTCEDQVLEVSGKKISLKGQDAAMWAEAWACFENKKQAYLALTFNNGGSCEQCEVVEVYSIKGQKLTSAKKSYTQLMKQWKLQNLKLENQDIEIFPPRSKK